MEKINRENMKAIIIDDEQQSHLVLSNLLTKNHMDITLIGNAYNVKEGIRLIKEVQPELVFLDVEMPDGTGLDLLQHFGNPNFNVIFITGYNHYAHAAIRFGALDYLLKPVIEEELQEAINRAKNKKAEKIAQLQIQILTESLAKLQTQQLPTRLAISTLEGIIYKEVKDIVRLEAKQNYTEITFASTDKKILVSINLGEYEEQFKAYPEFMRVHRSHLVNLRYVERFVKGEGYLVSQNEESIIVSRRYRDEIINFLSKL